MPSRNSQAGGRFSTRRIAAALLFVALASGAQIELPEKRQAASRGRTAIAFYAPLMRELGWEVRNVHGAEAPVDLHPLAVGMSGAMSFPSNSASALAAGLQSGGVVYEGLIEHGGGFDIVTPDGRIELDGFSLRPSGLQSFELLDVDGSPVFVATHPQGGTEAVLATFRLFNLDLRIARALAQRLGHPELANVAVGTLATRGPADISPSLSTSSTCPEAGWDGIVDVALTGIFSVGQADASAGTISVTPSVELENVGTADVPWYSKFNPISPPPDPLPGSFSELDQHPYLVWALYRLDSDERLTQLAVSPVKHAFNATNTDCGCPSSSHPKLYPGCRDLYGEGTNRSDSLLGPREEVTAHLGEWRSCDSHFDGDGDCMEDTNHHPVEPVHRLSVQEAELDLPGMRYFVEAWYVVRADVDIWNSMGSVEVDPTPPGELWTFPLVPPGYVPGPVVDRWVDPDSAPSPEADNRTLSTVEGHLQLAVKKRNLGGGQYAYDYALANHDYDRRIGSFEVPLPTGVVPSSFFFADSDDDPANDWTPSFASSAVTWSASTADDALDWGRMLSFSFEAATADIPRVVNLTPEEAGAGADPTFTDLGTVLFSDGFESGDLTRWTASRP